MQNTLLMFQYSLLGRSAALIRLNTTFRGLAPSPSSGLRIGTEPVPETLYSNELTRLCAREDYIESCRRESFKTYNVIYVLIHGGSVGKVICYKLHCWVCFQTASAIQSS
jgi:hypothetical protein